jgi:hypothetical protein
MMKRRTYAHFQNGQFATGWIKAANRPSPSAWMSEFLVAKGARTIDAFGGPCPIIALFDPTTGVGALIHIDGGQAEQDGDEHETLIDALLDNIDEITAESAIYVFFDPVPFPNFLSSAERAEQRQARRAYIDRVVGYLQDRGFAGIRVVSKGRDKSVFLDTANRRLRATAGNGDVLLDIAFND